MFHARMVYDKKAVCQSRVTDDYQRVVNVDENGDERITFEKVDYPKIQSSLGSCDKWSLNALMDAGIDPDFGIRTGFGTRLEGERAVAGAIARVNAVVESDNKTE